MAKGDLAELNPNLAKLPGFRIVRTVGGAGRVVIHASFGVRKRTCPGCSGRLWKHGQAFRTAYDRPYFKTMRRYRIIFSKMVCGSCRSMWRQQADALPPSVVEFPFRGGRVLVTRRLKNRIADSGFSTRRIALESGICRSVVREVRRNMENG